MKLNRKKPESADDAHLKQKILLLVIPLLVIVGLAIYATAQQHSPVIPSSFTASQDALASISKDIANLNQTLSQQIAGIQEAKKNGDRATTLSLVDKAKETNTSISKKAENFAANLEVMKKSVIGFTSTTSQALASEALETESSLIKEFQNYTSLLDQFLSLLSTSVSNDSQAIEDRIKNLLTEINSKAENINALNARFIQQTNILTKSL